MVSETLSSGIADTVQRARQAHGWSVSTLAERSGVSRAMITRIERETVQPTAVLLGRLSGALGMSLSQLLARAEDVGSRVSRAVDQPRWTDPGTGYVRRSVSPAPGGPLELVEVELPPGAEVAFPAEAFAFTHHQIWVQEGHLRFREGEVDHRLGPGDCLRLGPPEPCVYVNETDRPVRYVVALARH